MTDKRITPEEIVFCVFPRTIANRDQWTNFWVIEFSDGSFGTESSGGSPLKSVRGFNAKNEWEPQVFSDTIDGAIDARIAYETAVLMGVLRDEF